MGKLIDELKENAEYVDTQAVEQKKVKKADKKIKKASK